MRWTAQTLARDAGGHLRHVGAARIEGAFIDSRTPVPGALFVPIVAARDGHDFIQAAVDAGATAVLQQPGKPMPRGGATVVEVDDTLAALRRLGAAARAGVSGPVVAITGSNGKTTTRAMVAAVLSTGFDPVLCTRGNLNNHLGVPLTLVGPPNDPAAMVIELGMSAPGENDDLAALVRPTVGVITSVALEHLEFMGSIEAIAAAEAEVIAHVAPSGTVVIPGDEPLLEPHRGESRAPIATFGTNGTATVRVAAVDVGPPTVATLAVGDERVQIPLQLFGAHNARNAAAAVAVGHALGLPLGPMARALSGVAPVGDRGRVLRKGEHVVIADCYNSNPGSAEAALRSLADLRGARSGPLIAVLGDMLELGETEDELHAEVGELCAELGLDAVVAVGPRSRHIAEAAGAQGLEAWHHDDDVAGAADFVEQRLASAPPGAVLVKASRGIRLERVVEALVPKA